MELELKLEETKDTCRFQWTITLGLQLDLELELVLEETKDCHQIPVRWSYVLEIESELEPPAWRGRRSATVHHHLGACQNITQDAFVRTA